MPFFRLLVPGLVFQAVVVGAGYATGRELVQFFMTGTLASGLLAMAVAALVWSLTLAVALENARLVPVRDYRSFLRSLIGPLWILYEICFAILLVLVLSVLASAAGEIVLSRLGWPPIAGIVVMMAAIASLVFFGTGMVERFLTIWSILLYILFGLVLAICLAAFGGEIGGTLTGGAVEPGWLAQGVSYAGYNLSVVPAILYCTRHLRSRRDALIAGALAGPIAMLPALLFFASMSAFWPEIVKAPVPIDFVLERIGQPWLSILFYVALFGIFIKTGAALIHAVNERVATALQENGRTMPRWLRPAIALACTILAGLLAEKVGIVALIADGYQILTIAFLIVFVLPLITVGGWRIITGRTVRRESAAPETP